MPSCACIDYYNDYGPSWSSAEYRKARKPHTCGECNELIQPGDRYERIGGVWDGFWAHHVTCESCMEIRDLFFCRGFVFGEMENDLWEHLRDMNGEKLPWEKIGKLSPRPREIVLDMIQRVWDRLKDHEK